MASASLSFSGIGQHGQRIRRALALKIMRTPERGRRNPLNARSVAGVRVSGSALNCMGGALCTA